MRHWTTYLDAEVTEDPHADLKSSLRLLITAPACGCK